MRPILICLDVPALAPQDLPACPGFFRPLHTGSDVGLLNLATLPNRLPSLFHLGIAYGVFPFEAYFHTKPDTFSVGLALLFLHLPWRSFMRPLAV